MVVEENRLVKLMKDAVSYQYLVAKSRGDKTILRFDPIKQSNEVSLVKDLVKIETQLQFKEENLGEVTIQMRQQSFKDQIEEQNGSEKGVNGQERRFQIKMHHNDLQQNNSQMFSDQDVDENYFSEFQATDTALKSTFHIQAQNQQKQILNQDAKELKVQKKQVPEEIENKNKQKPQGKQEFQEIKSTQVSIKNNNQDFTTSFKKKFGNKFSEDQTLNDQKTQQQVFKTQTIKNDNLQNQNSMNQLSQYSTMTSPVYIIQKESMEMRENYHQQQVKKQVPQSQQVQNNNFKTFQNSQIGQESKNLLVINQDGDKFALGTNSKKVVICQIPKLKQDNILIVDPQSNQSFAQIKILNEIDEHHKSGIYCVDWSNSYNLIGTGSNDKSVKVCIAPFNSNSNHLKKSEMIGHQSIVRSVLFNPQDSKQIMSCGEKDPDLKLWSCDTSQNIFNLEGHETGIICAKASYDKSQVITVGADQRVMIWDVRQRKRIDSISNSVNMSGMLDLAINNEDQAFVAHSDGSLSIWDLKSRKLIRKQCSQSKQGGFVQQ
eukprot:403337636